MNKSSPRLEREQSSWRGQGEQKKEEGKKLGESRAGGARLPCLPEIWKGRGGTGRSQMVRDVCVPCRACSLHLVNNEEPWDGSGRDTYIRGRVKLRPLVLGLESRAGHRDEPCLNTATRVSETPHCWLSSTLEVTIGMDGED